MAIFGALFLIPVWLFMWLSGWWPFRVVTFIALAGTFIAGEPHRLSSDASALLVCADSIACLILAFVIAQAPVWLRNVKATPSSRPPLRRLGGSKAV